MTLIRSLDALAARPEIATAASVGGKAARLAWLTRQGFEVPRGWVIGADRFRALVALGLTRQQAPKSLLERVGTEEALRDMAAARARILSEPLDPVLRGELELLWSWVSHDAPWGLAVRSSATCEDEELTAMAGLATTVLGVRGAEALAEAVRTVWASALMPQALEHLAARGIDDIAMAVVVQVVVPAEASGVMFTRPPTGVHPKVWGADERLVNATFGLGAPVANGAITPDVIRFAARTGEVRSTIVARKNRALVVGASGSHYVDVPRERADLPALSPEVIQSLGRIADRLEQIDPSPHDVEFVVERGRVMLVQARPVVGSGYPEGGDSRTIWSRANVGEALPGAATPLTWSVAGGFSKHGFMTAFRSLGCHVPPEATLVANVHGRFYLNMTWFMRIATQVPGLDPATLMRLGGGEGAELLEGQIERVSPARFLSRLPWTTARLAAEQLTLSTRVDRYVGRMSRRFDARRRSDLGALSDRALAATLRDTLADLDETGTLMLACASSSLGSNLLLQTWIKWVANGDAARLAQVLSAGLTELESARPGIAIAHIAAAARRDTSVYELLAAGRVKSVSQLPAGPVRRALERFFEEFGDRAVREAEVAAPRWREDQHQVFAMLQTAMHKSADDTDSSMQRARKAADRELDRIGARIGGPATAVLRVLVAHTRRTTRLRERMRAWVTRTISQIRMVTLEADRRIRLADPGLEPGAAFYCHADELIAALESGHIDLGNLVRLRRAEHMRDEARPEPPVTFVGCPTTVVLPPSGGDTLTGLPACSGVVEGTVRVLPPGRELEEDLQPGEILVARTTDVALTPLFLVAAGVVTELGGPLSHAALVAREYGVPTVVNVAGVTLALRTGDRVRVDGTQGTVERLSPRPEALRTPAETATAQA